MKTKPDHKDDNDDVLKQSNKAHKGVKEKLKKKRKQEKEIKKQKKEKRKEKKLKELKKKARKEKRDKKREKDDSDDEGSKDGEETKLLKYIKRLKVFMEEEADDLFEMLETIDAGGEVDIEGLENAKIKNYLRKIFKYMNLKKNPETNEYSKDMEANPESLKRKFQDLWYQGVDTESSDLDDDKGEEKKKMEEEKEEEEMQQVVNEEEMLKAKNALLEGIKDLPVEEPKEEVAEASNEPDGIKRIKGEEWRSFLDEKFGALVGDDKKGYSKLGKKVGPGGTEEERSERDKKIDEFMTDYNSQFRRKSLLEEHQERKNKAAAAAGPGKERRAFDRDLDINMSRIDSKKVFQMINSKDNNLTSRFGHSGTGNKYL